MWSVAGARPQGIFLPLSLEFLGRLVKNEKKP
jgi:hypothetical protein